MRFDPKGCQASRVDSSVKIIRKGALKGLKDLGVIEISEGVEEIEKEAISHMVSLKRVVLPTTLRVVKEDSFPFLRCGPYWGCRGGPVFEAPDFLYNWWCSIPPWAVNVQISPNVNTLPDGAFSSCYFLQKLELPASLTTIPRGAFEHHCRLEVVLFSDGLVRIGENSFAGCCSLTRNKTK